MNLLSKNNEKEKVDAGVFWDERLGILKSDPMAADKEMFHKIISRVKW